MKQKKYMLIMPILIMPFLLAAEIISDPRSELVKAYFAWSGEYAEGSEESKITYTFGGEKKFAGSYDGGYLGLVNPLLCGLGLAANSNVFCEEIDGAINMKYAYHPLADESRRIELDVIFKKLFGKPIVASKAKKSSTGEMETDYSYAPAGIEAAFQKLYVKPNGRIDGYAAGVLYNTVFKDFMTKFVSSSIKFAPDQKFLAKSIERINKGEETPYICSDAVKAVNHLSDDADFQDEDMADYEACGFVLRRQMEGSLPVFRTIIKTIIQDYDPDLFRQIGSKI